MLLTLIRLQYKTHIQMQSNNNTNQYSQAEVKQYYNKKAIRQRKYQIQLENTDRFRPQFIRAILPMYDKSFILLQIHNLIHISNDGKILKQLRLQHPILEAQAITNKIALIMYTSYQQNLGYLLQWNLLTNSTITIKLKKHHQYCKFNFIVFPQTKLTCISQRVIQNTKNRNIIQQYYLYYYKYPLQSAGDSPIYSFSSKKQQSDKQFTYIQKLNNKSMVGWFHHNYILSPFSQLTIYDPQRTIDQDGNPCCKSYKFQNTFNMYPNICSCNILDVWEIKDGIFYIKIQTEVDFIQQTQNKRRKKLLFQQQQPQVQYNQKQKNLDKDSINDKLSELEQVYSFVWEYQTGKFHTISFQINTPHQIQFLGQLRPLKKSQSLRLQSLQRRQLQMFTQFSPEYKSIIYPFAFVNVIEDNLRLVCLEKQKNKQKYSYMNDYDKYVCVPLYDTQSYFQFQFDFRYQDEYDQSGNFKEWSFDQQQQEEQLIFQHEIKVEQANKQKLQEKKYKNVYYRSNLRLAMKVSHKKIKYFQYSNKEVAVWALTNIIQDCNENLLYDVCSLFGK